MNLLKKTQSQGDWKKYCLPILRNINESCQELEKREWK